MPKLKLNAALETWLQFFDSRRVEMRRQLKSPASEEQIRTAEQKIGVIFPKDIRELYKTYNGQHSPYKVTYFKDKPNLIELPFSIDADAFVGNLFGSYEFLSLDDLVETWMSYKAVRDHPDYSEDDYAGSVSVCTGDLVKKQYINNLWIPIAKDGGGNTYCFDMDPPDGGIMGQIIVVGPDEDTRKILATGIADLFSNAPSIANDFYEKDQRLWFRMEKAIY